MSKSIGLILPALLALAVATSGAQAVEWGSIYYSPSTHATGFSHNYDTQRQAERAAASYCRGGDCEYAISFRNACGRWPLAAMAAGAPIGAPRAIPPRVTPSTPAAPMIVAAALCAGSAASSPWISHLLRGKPVPLFRTMLWAKKSPSGAAGAFSDVSGEC